MESNCNQNQQLNYNYSLPYSYPSTTYSYDNPTYNNYPAQFTYSPTSTSFYYQSTSTYPSYSYHNNTEANYNGTNSPASTYAPRSLSYTNSTPIMTDYTSSSSASYYQYENTTHNYSNESYSNFTLNNDSAYQSQLDTSDPNQVFYQNNISQDDCQSLQKIETSLSKKRKRNENELVQSVNKIFDEAEIKKKSTNDEYDGFKTTDNHAKRPKIFKLAKLENNENELKCPNCTLVFNSAAKLLMHRHKYHKNGSSSVCPICYKKFGNQANALVHLRGHTQEKTYKCSECENAFYDSSTLKKHMRTHTGEKPYECNLCSKKFTQSGNLKRHLLVHQKYDFDEKTNEDYPKDYDPLTEGYAVNFNVQSTDQSFQSQLLQNDLNQFNSCYNF